MKRKPNYWGGALAALALLAGCAKNEILPKDPSAASSKNKFMTMTVTRDSNLVDSSMAAYLASYYNTDILLKHTKSTTQRSIVSAYSIPDKNGDPALYVFNYAKNEGYVVISADFRYQPILSIADDGNLNQKDAIPSMLGSWFGRMVENVQVLRDGTYNNTAVGYQDWNSLMGGGSIPPNNNIYPMPDNPSGGGTGNPCDAISYSLGPLMQTTWAQDCGFNDYTPACSTHVCGHTPAGCVATAMAQILKYWALPDSHYYNYASMPITDIGSTEISRLMHDCGLSVNMNYTCTASGANADDIAGALRNTFLYHTATHDSYNGGNDLLNIETDLANNKPVIFDGCTALSHFLGFPYGSGTCHAWVCDGYTREGTTCAVETHLHMNWGLTPYPGNSWNYLDDWGPTGVNYSFQYAMGYTHNIHP